MCDPLSLDAGQLSALRSTWWHYGMSHIIEAAPFRAPFESYFIGNDSVPNFRHPTTIALLRSLAAVSWHQLKKTRHPADIGKTQDQLKLVADNLEYGALQKMLDGLWAMVKQYNFLDLEVPPPLSKADYIPVATSSRWMQRALSPKDHKETAEFRALTDPYLRCFGQASEEVEPEEAPDEIIKAMEGRA